MMILLWFASFVTLVILAVEFIVALVVRLFTKRRPPLVTWRAVVVAALATGVWYSPYQPPVQIVVCFDESGRLFYQTACD